jgi:hypothetical protein
MKLRCVHEFDDLRERVWRHVGDEFEVTDERYEEIVRAETRQGVRLVEPVEEPAPAPKPKRQRTSKAKEQ